MKTIEKKDNTQARPVDVASFPACHGAGGIAVRHIVPARKVK